MSQQSTPDERGGPQATTPELRRARAAEIVRALQRRYGEAVIAVGYYGSLARGTDGPYSDIEIQCIVGGAGLERDLEWNAGGWKAEVNVQSQDVILRDASAVGGRWPITHGSYANILPVFDPQAFFEGLRQVVYSQPESKFQAALRELIVGDLLEQIGKVRNAWVMGNPGYLPTLACELVRSGAFLVGLANRFLYSSASRLMAEALELPNQPAGYRQVCQLVAAGELADPKEIVKAANRLWAGVEEWAAANHIGLVQQLDELL